MNYKIIYEKRFFDDIKEIIEYIKKDKPQSAAKFKKDLKNKIENLSHFPFKYRKSIYFDDESIRDLIFKGYIIPYKITDTQIIILGITKYKPF